jgi:hypothetical protein
MAAMVQPAPNSEALDAYLSSMVQTVKSAVDQAMRKVDEDPDAVEKALKDCEEILGHVMEGNVQEWIH